MTVFTPPFAVGTVVTNNQITSTFKVGNMGGMRRSKTTGTLVVISDHTKGLYDDKWYGDELHYTGMGTTGDQDLNGAQNKTLAGSNTNGVEVHLFEVLKKSKYIYQGIVRLNGEPYQENQRDSKGNDRKVWMFPLQTMGHATSISENEFESYVKDQDKKARLLSPLALEKRQKKDLQLEHHIVR